MMSESTISVQCPECKRRVNDTPRADYDPPAAVLFVTLCPKCCHGCKVEGGRYYDASGKEIDWRETPNE